MEVRLLVRFDKSLDDLGVGAFDVQFEDAVFLNDYRMPFAFRVELEYLVRTAYHFYNGRSLLPEHIETALSV